MNNLPRVSQAVFMNVTVKAHGTHTNGHFLGKSGLASHSINQSIMALLKYDKTHIMTKYVLVRVLKKHVA